MQGGADNLNLEAENLLMGGMISIHLKVNLIHMKQFTVGKNRCYKVFTSVPKRP